MSKYKWPDCLCGNICCKACNPPEAKDARIAQLELALKAADALADAVADDTSPRESSNVLIAYRAYRRARSE